ncbi:MAG: I78 family peptidase inhibitor [Bacillota bacterium]
MRRTMLFAPVLLAACSTAPAPTNADTPVHGVTPGHKCETAGTDQFIGQTRSDEVGARIKEVSHAAVLRWAPPGVMLTMDFREDRVTVWLDPANKITQIKCG